MADLISANLRREGLVVGSDGQAYPPQLEPRGRAEVVALLLQSDAGLTSEQAEAVVPQILAAVNLLGPKLCTCLHVDGWSDPAHGHGYYQCETCGGLCCSERWVGHEVMGLRWMELMMQHHRHSQVVVRGLNFIQERMLGAIEVIARTVPPERQKAVVRRLVETELGNLSHIWFQSVMGDYLYQTGETRGGPTTPRIYEESAERLVEKLHALKSGCTPEEFRAQFEFQDALAPEEALTRVEESRHRNLEAARVPAALPEAEGRETFTFDSPEVEKVTAKK